jgi:uncharacterized protein YjbI with pentapeptide repeats
MASLSWADLTGADLSGTNLMGANLWGVDFREANLSGADLCGVDLRGVDLRETNLSRANLSGINLTRKDLSGTNLSGANLSQANLSGQDLSGQDLSGANLSGANLSGVDFIRALLSGTDFSQANLIKASFNGAVLSNACLWETQRAGWSIQDIICEAVYWGQDKRERTLYSAGEFERLYADKTKIVLHYEGGLFPIEIATLPALIQRIEATHPGCVLRLQSVQEAPSGATVTLVVEDEGGRSPDELRTLKAAMETAAQDVLHYQRAWLQETGRREQIENMYYRLFHQMIGHASGASISIRDSTIQGNIVGHLSGSDAEVQYGESPAAVDTKA